MKPFVKKLILSGLMLLPTACATYTSPYYGSGYGSGYSYDPGYGSSYYSSPYYSPGYSVIERNYYNTYSYPVPSYQTNEHHHHYDGHDNRRPFRPPQDRRPYPNFSGSVYPRQSAEHHNRDDHYNWKPKPENPSGGAWGNWGGRDEHRGHHDGQHGRPMDQNAFGQWQRPQNWGQNESRHGDNNGNARPSFGRENAGWQNRNAQPRVDDEPARQGGHGRPHRGGHNND